jgi:CrcB protein
MASISIPSNGDAVTASRTPSPSVPRDLRLLAAVFTGGALGAGVRTGLVQLSPAAAGSWPWVTFSVNVVGSLLLGYVVTCLPERMPVTAYAQSFLGTGFCGALTTFSTFQVELLTMLDRGAIALAALYCAGSVVAGLAGVGLGTAAVRRARLTW